MQNFKHIAFLFILISSFSAVGNSSFQEGVSSFNEKDYQLSISKFDSILLTSPQNIGALYNLGMAHLENKQYGEAIWTFERVLKHQPNDTEAKENIRECYFQLYPSFYWEFRLNGFQTILYSISPNAWGYITIISSIFISLMIVLFMKSATISMRRIALFTGFTFFIIFLFSLITGSFVKEYRLQENRAVVLKKNTQSLSSDEKINEGQVLECSECVGDTITFTTKNKQEVRLLRGDIGFI